MFLNICTHSLSESHKINDKNPLVTHSEVVCINSLKYSLEPFRNTLHRITSPRPVAHEIVVLGGRAREREGQVERKYPKAAAKHALRA